MIANASELVWRIRDSAKPGWTTFDVETRMGRSGSALSDSGTRHALSTRTAIISALAAPLNVMSAGLAGSQNIPATIELDNKTHTSLGGQSGDVCVIGSSVASKNGTGIILVPAYYLNKGSWTAIPDGGVTVNAYALDPGPKEINTLPGQNLDINSARIHFYYKKLQTDCSDIKFSIPNKDGSGLDVPLYQYPSQIWEYTAVGTGDGKGLHIDTSNVDNTQLLINMSFTETRDPTKTFTLGNPVDAAGVSTTNVVKGSAFVDWLSLQPGYDKTRCQTNLCAFSDLNASGLAPFALIVSPTDYIRMQCRQHKDGKFYPNSCQLNYAFVNFHTALNSYYETPLKNFFTQKVGLKVMGDASGSIQQPPWHVTNDTESCPFYLNPDKASLEFTYIGNTQSFVLCNPAGQVVALNGATQSGATPSVNQKAGGNTATMTLSKEQFDQIVTLSNKGINWNIGQKETSWVGNITRTVPENNTIAVNVAVQDGLFSQKQCTANTGEPSKSNCPLVNPSYNTWTPSNIPWGGTFQSV
jgi:hypothetical protein